MITYRNQYDFANDRLTREETDLDTFEETLTIQDAPDSDINDLMRRFGVQDGSVLPASMGVVDPTHYGDFSDMPDLRTALDRTRSAEDAFAQLPAKLRARFNNDPYQLHTWVHRTENLEEAITLGLLARKAPDPERIAPATQQTGSTPAAAATTPVVTQAPAS